MFPQKLKWYSCADIIVQSGIKEIFIGYLDPDPRTSGKSVSFFRKSGIVINVGLCGEKAKDINAGFNSRLTNNLPYITFKVAISLDGKIALKNKTSKWLSNKLSRNFSHLLRSQYDGIMTSSNNILYDDPELTCRLPGLEKKSPFKIIVDRKLKIKDNSKVLKSFYGEKTIIYYSSNLVKNSKKTLLNKNNIIYRDIKYLKNRKNTWLAILNDLASFGINNLMIESGPTFVNDLIKLRLISEINLFRSNKILGNDGLPFIGERNLTNIKKAFYYK
jgi:riboflavin biosynthesis protein RibD